MTTPKLNTNKDSQVYENFVKYDALYYEKANKADSQAQKKYNIL